MRMNISSAVSGASRGRPRRPPRGGVYFVLLGAGEAAAGDVAAGAEAIVAGVGVGKTPANCGSFVTMTACC
jgi:hypothetical protein